MASIVQSLSVPSAYKDQQYQGSSNQLAHDLANSTTLYVGNLSFYTTEEQIYELFSKCGEIKRIIMGLDRNQKTPCGFCFVEYYHHADALDCMKYINSSKLDERIVRSDLDHGYREGRQFGRGRSGGQVRDEYRLEFDAGRGGWGHVRARQEAERERDQKANYEAITTIPEGADQDYKDRKEAGPADSSKRARDDEEDEDEQQRSKANPRFREGDEDEEDA
ncbi:nuclear cap binding complex subunit [Dissophora globulifera]|uniref:Nuclear cap-binding protein subunit 2 n=1 Tax=Dissophora globulifera TaxID=979702 RepID=A0A9P6V0L8_9FUNG|nr:nuclear cap binding complex subunit [Dissophora globulifera]